MIVPWILSIVTAIWFGVMGLRADGYWLRWAVAGALFALVASTMVLGLCDAALFPTSPEEYVSFRINSVALAVLPILLVGGIPMIRLLRQGLSEREKTPSA